MDATDLLANVRLMPVVTLDDVDKATPLAQALVAGGIRAIEVTLRTSSALTVIKRIADTVPDILLGAGSVRQPEQFAQVEAAGCAFAVSPGATDALLDAATLPYVPGAATASECLHLLERGYVLQKFFPAESNGGSHALRALSQPLPEIRFCPTGGINAANVRDYLELDFVACVGGSWFVPGDQVAQGNFEAIEEAARTAVALAGS